MTITQEELNSVTDNLTNNFIGTANNLQNNLNVLQKQINYLDNKIKNSNNNIYKNFEHLLNIYKPGIYNHHVDIYLPNKPKMELNGETHIIYDIKNNTINLDITYTSQLNYTIENITQIRREIKFYIKDNSILYEIIAYNSSNIILSTRLGTVTNITDSSLEIYCSGSFLSTTEIVDNMLISVKKNNDQIVTSIDTPGYKLTDINNLIK